MLLTEKNELRQLCIKTYWSTLIQNFFLRGPAVVISWTPLVLIKPIRFSDEVPIRMLFHCCLLPETTKVNKKTKRNLKKMSLELVSGQTSMRSNRPLIRLVCAWNCLWSDRPRPNWPLIRPSQNKVSSDQASARHCPDKSALEAFSRPCNSSALGTCVRSKLVWSGVTSVWPPRPG